LKNNKREEVLPFSEISKSEAEELLENYMNDQILSRIIMDKCAQPGFQSAYKDFFDGLYVFCVKLSSELNLIISVDRTRFWKSSKDLTEISVDGNFEPQCIDSNEIKNRIENELKNKK
jgi:hypothetical protein